jgi:hypothetical protein
VTLETHLLELVSALERGSLPGPETLAASFARVEEALTAARAGTALDPEAWERCRRLHALALALAAERQGELATQRQACAELRERIGTARARVHSGASCDLDA